MARKLFQRVQRRRLGGTRENVQKVMLALDAETPLDQQPIELIGIQVMAALREEHNTAYCEADRVGFDWDSFLEFLIKLAELLMPFIIKNRPTAAPPV